MDDENVIKNYLSQWERLSPEDTAEKFKNKLSSACQSNSGNLHSCKFRSIYWRFYLGGLSAKRECWADECAIYRELYENLKRDHLPIEDAQLSTNIDQDVRRTMPDLTFFRSEDIHNKMTSILTIWSIASPGGQRLSYRQGIHELLAPILFVINFDHETLQAIKPISKEKNVKLPNDLTTILNPKSGA